MLRHLRLTRPLAAIDVETTGLLDADPHIVELAILRIDPDLSVKARVWRLNPDVPIPAAASNIHGITDTQVAGCPGFGDVLAPLMDLLWNCDLTGFNLIRFDLPVLDLELSRCGVALLDTRHRLVLDSLAIFHRYYPPPPGTRGYGTLAAACQRYLGYRPSGAHGSLCDALAALQVLDAQVAWHCLPGDPGELLADLAPRPEPAAPAVQGRLLEEHPDSGAYGPQERRQ